jgi:choline dehydrogenase-like flavoprotein
MSDGGNKSNSTKRLIILGAGPAGLTLAEFLIEQGLDVHVYDRGQTNSSFYSVRGKSKGDDFNAGGIGGSTHAWGGQLLRLNEIDRNNWLSFDGVDEGFLENIEICTDEILRRLGRTIPRNNQYGFDKTNNSLWRVTGSQILLEKDIGRIFKSTIESPKFNYSEGVSAIRFQEEKSDLFLILSSGERISLSQNYVFLALGAIENAAILIRSQSFVSELNSREIGTNLQDHPHGVVMKVSGFGGPFNRKRTLLSLPKNCDKRKFEFTHNLNGCPRSAILELHENFYATTIRNEFKTLLDSFHLKSMLKLCSRIFLKSLRILLKREIVIQFAEVWIQYEQSRNISSRILVDSEIRHEWTQNEDDLRFVNNFIEEVDSFLTNQGFTVFDKISFKNVVQLNEWSSEAYHPSGTIPLGSTVEGGVASLAGAVHALPNTYLVGSGLFPTGGWFNPTLVIMAMSRAVAKEFVHRNL